MTFIYNVCVYYLFMCIQSLEHIIHYYHQTEMHIYISRSCHNCCFTLSELYEELCTLPRSINIHHFMTLDKPFKCHTDYNMRNINSSHVAELSALCL